MCPLFTGQLLCPAFRTGGAGRKWGSGRKADMFTKRTIKPHTPVTSVDTASEALAVSMGEKAYVDMEYMCSLAGKTEQEIYEELKGVIFLNPMYGYGNSTERKYLMADEYLSGNVREKSSLGRKNPPKSTPKITKSM